MSVLNKTTGLVAGALENHRHPDLILAMNNLALTMELLNKPEALGVRSLLGDVMFETDLAGCVALGERMAKAHSEEPDPDHDLADGYATGASLIRNYAAERGIEL